MPNGGTIAINTENISIETESGIPLPVGKYIKIGIEEAKKDVFSNLKIEPLAITLSLR